MLFHEDAIRFASSRSDFSYASTTRFWNPSRERRPNSRAASKPPLRPNASVGPPPEKRSTLRRPRPLPSQNRPMFPRAAVQFDRQLSPMYGTSRSNQDSESKRDRS